MLIVCKRSSVDNIVREIREECSKDKPNPKWLTSLGKLLCAISDMDNDEIKKLALSLDAIDLIGWKSK